ncbi:MAG: hypothetical protein V2A74_08585, partial [bacterium]
PSHEQYKRDGSLAQKLRKGELPELGFVLWGVYAIPWGDIKNPEQLNNLVSQAESGVALARELAIPEYLHESLVVQGYVQALKALWELRSLVKPEGIAQTDKETARSYFRMYVAGLTQSRNELPKWEFTLPMRPADEHLVEEKPVTLLNEMIKEMKTLAADLEVSLE